MTKTSSQNLSPLDVKRLPYRPGVGIMLISREAMVLVAQRRDSTADAWQMPQGGIEKGETPRQAAFRELREEIGTDNALVVAESKNWLHYDYPLELINEIGKGRCRGQRQKWFLMRFLGRDSEINLETPEPEFSAWRWTTIESLPELVFPIKRKLYCDLLDQFGALVHET